MKCYNARPIQHRFFWIISPKQHWNYAAFLRRKHIFQDFLQKPSKPGFYIEKQPAAIDRNHISVKLTQNNPKKQKLEISHLRTYNTKGRYFSDLRKTNCLDTFK